MPSYFFTDPVTGNTVRMDGTGSREDAEKYWNEHIRKPPSYQAPVRPDDYTTDPSKPKTFEQPQTNYDPTWQDFFSHAAMGFAQSSYLDLPEGIAQAHQKITGRGPGEGIYGLIPEQMRKGATKFEEEAQKTPAGQMGWYAGLLNPAGLGPEGVLMRAMENAPRWLRGNAYELRNGLLSPWKRRAIERSQAALRNLMNTGANLQGPAAALATRKMTGMEPRAATATKTYPKTAAALAGAASAGLRPKPDDQNYGPRMAADVAMGAAGGLAPGAAGTIVNYIAKSHTPRRLLEGAGLAALFYHAPERLLHDPQYIFGVLGAEGIAHFLRKPAGQSMLAAARSVGGSLPAAFAGGGVAGKYSDFALSTLADVQARRERNRLNERTE
jgi:hypothetical protein